MSNHSATIDSKTAKALFEEIELYRSGLAKLHRKLMRLLPDSLFKYGGDLWWKKSDFEAIDSIKAGKGKKFSTYEEAVKYLTD